MFDFTESELLFIARATWEDNDTSNIMIMVEDWGYTPQQVGGFISSIKQKGGCSEFEKKGWDFEMKECGELNYKYASKHFWFPRQTMEDYYCGGDKNPSVI